MSQPTVLLLALADFNDARLNDDENIARKATPGPWIDQGGYVTDVGPKVQVTDYGTQDSFGGGQQEEEKPQGRADSRHIARHNPARVLADVAWKRLLIANWRALILRIDAEQDAEKREQLALTRHGLDQAAFLMAAVHDKHPDYQPDFRP